MNESGLWTKIRGAIDEHPRAGGVKSYDPIILGWVLWLSLPVRSSRRPFLRGVLPAWIPRVRWYE